MNCVTIGPVSALKIRQASLKIVATARQLIGQKRIEVRNLCQKLLLVLWQWRKKPIS